METTTMTNNAPAVYVGTWAKYNAGNLHGAWLYVSDYETEEEFYNACRELHSDERDPELMFQDYDNTPDELASEVSINFDALKLYAELCEDYTPEAVAAYIDCFGASELERFADRYCGDYSGYWNPREQFATELAEETFGSAIESLGGYFDYAAYARDLFINDYCESGGYIFC